MTPISKQWAAAWLTSLALWAGGSAQAVLFFATDDPTHHASAPTGAYENVGWQYQGTFGSVTGTLISPTHFITAAHADSPFPTFNHAGNAYTILSKSFIAGTDLMVVEVDAAFSSWAPLYTGIAPVGQEVVMMGMGGPRGSAITSPTGLLQGWHTGPADGVLRWGTNVIDGVQVSDSLGQLLYATFDDGLNEAGLSLFDSGGGVFVLDNGIWKLAGINYGADTFATSASGTGRFVGALFDPSGFYRFEDGTWEIQTEADPGTRYYFSQISSAADAIYAVTAVPEPSTALYVISLIYFFGRRKRSTRHS